MTIIFGRNGLSRTKYTPLKSLDAPPPCSSRSIFISSLLSTAIVVLGVTLLSILSFIAGRHSLTIEGADSILNLTSRPHVFRYHRLFAEPPNSTTDKAWLSLFPTQGGFFKHPVLAPKRSTFAVFHQIHCLDGMRHGYWALFDLASHGQKLNETELPFHASPRHIRHCIDLLRNVLMCQPDLTLEVRDDELGGVTGFGTEHQCIDWRKLVDWTTEWETYQQEPGRKKKLHDHESRHHPHRIDD
ncbi:hypothetical protein CC78DRAFT_503967 [Lojkania enalia]|uniref:Uncharacterized protein n=1 Tax=Lojkania enalia TaxID=147567 RepID=A0A9P4JYD9_9PLEO|nr:hypothetical protein CC78DRAFT_503967 [Didymosphaeria enalia]